MNKKFLGYLIAAVLIAAALAYTGESSDFGNFAGDSDYGHESSSSGGFNGGGRDDYDYSGGYSRGSSSGYDNNNSGVDLGRLLGGVIMAGSSRGGNDSLGFFDDDDDNNNGCDDGAGIGLVVGAFMLFVILMNFAKAKRKARREQEIMPGAISTSELRTLLPMDKYLEFDKNFSDADLCEHMGNLYVQMQEGWHNKNIENVRPWLTDKFFNQMNNLLEQNRKQHQTDFIEKIAVLGTGLKGFYQAKGYDFIVAMIKTRIITYTLDDLTGKLVSGDRKREKFMEYEWELTRESGVQTTAAGFEIKSGVCPNCGAPLNVNASAKCPYCGAVLTAGNEVWAVCSIKGIAQRTN